MPAKPYPESEIKRMNECRRLGAGYIFDTDRNDRFLDTVNDRDTTIDADRQRFEQTIKGYTDDWADQKRKFEKRIAELESSVKFNDKIAELHYFKYVELEKIWQRVTGREKTWPDRGALLDWLKTHIAELEAANQRLRDETIPKNLVLKYLSQRIRYYDENKFPEQSRVVNNAIINVYKWLTLLIEENKLASATNDEAEQALRPQGGKPCDE